MRYTALLLIGLAVLIEAFGDILFKEWSLHDSKWLFVAAFVVYALGSIPWALSLKYGLLSRSIVIFTVLNVLIVAVAGLLLFKEQLSIANFVGIFLSVLGIVLIEI